MGRGIKKKALRFFLALFLIFQLCLQFFSYKTQAASSNVFCLSGKVYCTSGQFATCSNSSYDLKCLPGLPNDFPDCCRYTGAAYDCNDNYLACTNNFPSSSSSSSSSSGAYCSSGNIFCTSGQFPACNDSTYFLICLESYPYDFPDCCKRSGTAFDCRPNFLVCSSSNSSNRNSPQSSSSSGGDSFFTSSSSSSSSSSSGVAAGLAPAGSSSSGVVAGLAPASGGGGGALGLLPDEGMIVSLPVPDVEAGFNPALPSSSGSNIIIQDKFQKITLDVLKSPVLPDIVRPSLEIDELTTNKGIAYIGSNPSFEIKLPVPFSNLEFLSVDLKDQDGQIFNNIPFNILPAQENFILTLTLPDDASKGDSRFALNLSDGSSFVGLIQVIDFLKTSVPGKKNLKEVAKPVISRLKAKKERQKLFIFLRGKNFVGKKFFYIVDDTTKILQTDSSNTFVTIFPSSLKIDLKQKIVSKKGKRMKIKFSAEGGPASGGKMEKVKELTNAVLVISTPRGIASRSFLIKPK